MRLPARIWWALYYSRNETRVLVAVSGCVVRGRVDTKTTDGFRCTFTYSDYVGSLHNLVFSRQDVFEMLVGGFDARWTERGRTWIEENDPNADAFRTVTALSVDG